MGCMYRSTPESQSARERRIKPEDCRAGGQQPASNAGKRPSKKRISRETARTYACVRPLEKISMSFQIHSLPYARFASLFELSDSELAAAGARRMVADSKPGFPCRVSLKDAEPGETVLLLNFEHQLAVSAYRSSHAIFVREHAEQAFPAVSEVPEVLASRLISIRAFDDAHDMVNADVIEGTELGEAIMGMLRDRKVAYLHLHNAKPGCYAARVTRA